MRIIRFIAILLAVFLLVLIVGPFLIPVPALEGTQPVQALADSDSHFIRVPLDGLPDGLNVHYKQQGQGRPAIILLHGFGASTFSWREVITPLSEYGTVVAFDRPAFGLTARPIPAEWQGQNPYSPSAQVNILFGLMDALDIRQAVLVGNSAGGTVAMNAALTQPERVLALVLVDAAVYSGGGAPGWVRPLLDTPQAHHLGPLLVRSIGERGMDLLDSAWHDRNRITPEIVEGYQRPLQAENWDVGLWQLTRSSRASDLADRLDEFTLPVLVVTGDDDRIVPTDDSLRLADEIPGAGLAVFESCGHVPQEECPEAFLQAVIPFLQQFSSP
jgi:pimeloyl-ACP methyl ester carboxylesterase